MSNYKESSIIGSKYVRCNGVYIDNTYGNIPTIKFNEEAVIILEDEVIHNGVFSNGVPFLWEDMSDPTKIIEILNPSTGESTGSTITYQELYISLYSLYLKLAKARDIQNED